MEPLEGYDERALQFYAASSYYVAARCDGMPQAQASAFTCEMFGHDAPRGMCLRCGLGADSSELERQRDRDLVRKRDEWLASRKEH
jgi:hypothetical protein